MRSVLRHRHLLAAGLVATAALPGIVLAADGDAVVAGNVSVETPTLRNLGFEWSISGDANRNARVAVAYRKRDEARWRAGMPLLRLGGEDVSSTQFAPALTYVAPNMFAGSVLDLDEDTEYVVRLTLTDPDGASGIAEQEMTVRTRAEPKPASDGRVFHVYPKDWKGGKQQPAFMGLLDAYLVRGLGGDWFNVPKNRVQPGDVILVHAGEYKEDRWHYGHELENKFVDCCGTQQGTYYLKAKGTAERPIVIKAAGDGEVVFNGDNVHNLFNVLKADYNYFEGITVRNTEVAFEAGMKDIAGAKGLTFKNMKFEDIGIGIHSDFSGSSNFFISDNLFLGRNDPSVMVGWGRNILSRPELRPASKMLSEYAIKVYGPGHVISYNAVYNFHDGIDHATYGDPDGWPNSPFELHPSSMDIYNNFVFNVHDNCFEADGSMQNMRIMRNICFNSAQSGYSLQPVLGGPAYFIRNILFHSNASAVKFSEAPSGGIFYHNSFFTPFAPGVPGSNMHLRNNLFLQQTDAIPAFVMRTYTNYSTSDYNGFQQRPGAPGFQWTAPAGNVSASRDVIDRNFPTLADYQAATGQDRHSIAVDYSAFEKVPPIVDGSPTTNLYRYGDYDFRLRKGSVAIDKGVAIAGVNDGFNGRAPDLGAVEYGTAPFWVGPRSGPGVVAGQRTGSPRP